MHAAVPGVYMRSKVGEWEWQLWLGNQFELISVYACCSTRVDSEFLEGGDNVPYGGMGMTNQLEIIEMHNIDP